MQKLHLKLATGEPLKISWRRGWRNMHVAVNEAEIGIVADKPSLKQGRDFTLPDGSKLTVRLGRLYGLPQLEVLHNGKPVAGSATDPHRQLMLSWRFTVAGGVLALLYGMQSMVQPDGGFISSHSSVMIGLGVTQIVLGLFVRVRSINALFLAMAVHSIGLTFMIVEGMPGNLDVSPLHPFEVLLGGAILLGMMMGLSAISKLRAEDKPTTANSQSDTWGKVFWGIPIIFALTLVPAFLVMLVLHKTVDDVAVPYLAFTVPGAVFVFVAKGLRSWEVHGATPRQLALVWAICTMLFMFTAFWATLYSALAFHLLPMEDAIWTFALAAIGGGGAGLFMTYSKVLKVATERAAKRQSAARRD
jgi:hypothetical protein